MILEPRAIFMDVWVATLKVDLADYSVVPYGDVPTRLEDCPRLNLQFIGDLSIDLSTASRSRRQTAKATAHVSAHIWVDNDLPTWRVMLSEYDRVQRVVSNSFRKMHLEDRLPEGIQITGLPAIKGKAFRLPANCQNTSITAQFLIQDLPLEFIISED